MYWRSGSNLSAADAARMAADVAAAFPIEAPFTPAAMAVVTWFGVAARGRGSVALNTFQAALAADAAGRSFVTLCYDALNWDSWVGVGATPYATAGFNAGGPGGASTSLFGSRSAADTSLPCYGTAAPNGCYTARTDGPAALVALAPGLYSGSGAARDPCAHSLTSLYAFGVGAGDALGPNADDDVAVVAWAAAPLVLFGEPLTRLFPSTNGLIGTQSDAGYVPSPLPFLDASPSIAVWWADGATQPPAACPAYAQAAPNNLYWRVSAPPAAPDAARMAADVAGTFPTEAAFTPAVVGVVTWFAWAGTDLGGAALNTVQAAFAADAAGRSFVTLW